MGANGYLLAVLACGTWGAAESRPARPGQTRAPIVVRFEATLYQVSVAQERVGALDARMLALRGATAGTFHKALSEFGATHTLYHVDQILDLRVRQEIAVTAQVPRLCHSRVSKGGARLGTVEYQRAGVTFRVSWRRARAKHRGIAIGLAVDASLTTPSHIDGRDGQAARVFHKITQHYDGQAALGQPMVLLSVDGATARKGDSLAYVTRFVLSDPSEPGKAAPGPAAEHMSARLCAAVYQVDLPDTSLTKLDARALAAQAHTADDFRNTLAALGSARSLYQVDQTVSLDEARSISVGAQVPRVVNRRVAPSGQKMLSTGYERVGAELRIVGRHTKGKPQRVDLQLKLTGLSDSDVQISSGVVATIFHQVVQRHGGALELDHPIVLVSADGATPSKGRKEGTLTATVTRIVWSADRR